MKHLQLKVERKAKPKLYAGGKHLGPDNNVTLCAIVLCEPSILFRYKVQGKQIGLQTMSPEPVTTCLCVLSVTPAGHLSRWLHL